MAAKYRQIEEWVRAQLAQGEFKPGDRFYTEAEIGARHGASRQTVRQALAGVERDGLLQRRRGSGAFVCQRPLARPAGAEPVIGVVSTYFSDYIFPGIITGVERELSKHGAGMQLAITHNRVQGEAAALQKMLEQGVNALIVEPTMSALPSPNRPVYEKLEAAGVPVVFFNARYAWARAPLAAMDDAAAGRIAARCLAQAGHKTIGAILKSDDLQGHLRYSGYLQALEAAGIAPVSEQVVWYATEDRAALFDEPGRLLERLKGCTAVLCYNDEIAVRLVAACKARGLAVPTDLSVIGIDNSALAALGDPPLTSVEHPKEALGARAAQMALAMLRGGEPPQDCLLAPSLVLRGTVGRPPKG